MRLMMAKTAQEAIYLIYKFFNDLIAPPILPKGVNSSSINSLSL